MSLCNLTCIEGNLASVFLEQKLVLCVYRIIGLVINQKRILEKPIECTDSFLWFVVQVVLGPLIYLLGSGT